MMLACVALPTWAFSATDTSPKKKKKSSPATKFAEPTPRPQKKSALSPDKPAAASTKKADSSGESGEKKTSESGKAASHDDASATAGGDRKAAAAPNATVEPEQIAEFASQPEPIRKLITSALALTKQNLTYTYGSAEPSSGGMDCSGTIYYLLHELGLRDVPRDASGQYSWARQEGQVFPVVSKKSGGFEFDDLRPGDLLFWSGTYTVDRDPPVTHSMIYLGTEKERGQRIMFGASDGRTYDGKSRWGVSVFDFNMPRPRAGEASAKADFIGYAHIPGLGKSASAAVASAPEKKATPEAAPDKKPTTKTSVPNATPRPKRRSTSARSTKSKR